MRRSVGIFERGIGDTDKTGKSDITADSRKIDFCIGQSSGASPCEEIFRFGKSATIWPIRGQHPTYKTNEA